MTTPNKNTPPITRRSFIAGTGASVVAFSILKPELIAGTDANSKINIGLIGCGGRGKWIANLFQQHGGYNLVAAADYFQSRVEEAGKKFNIPAANCYSGLSGYRKLLDQKLDAVVIESPPYFHPEQAAAAVDAGKHVYLAKPAAVDVPGCMTIEASGKKATDKKLCFLVDFQTRTNKDYQEVVRTVQAGEIGKIISAEANYQTGLVFESADQALRKDPTNPELRLAAWGSDRALSGDIITEQNIHALDVACWILNAAPLRAYGTGGRVRDYVGNCWDHFAVIYYFPNNVILSFNSHQSGFGYDDIMCRVYCMEGTADTHYFGAITIKGKDARVEAKAGNMYIDGANANIAAFRDNIVKGDCTNPTVAPSVRSNLTTILGRTAAYKDGVVTWKEMMDAKEKLLPDLKGLKA